MKLSWSWMKKSLWRLSSAICCAKIRLNWDSLVLVPRISLYVLIYGGRELGTFQARDNPENEYRYFSNDFCLFDSQLRRKLRRKENWAWLIKLRLVLAFHCPFVAAVFHIERKKTSEREFGKKEFNSERECRGKFFFKITSNWVVGQWNTKWAFPRKLHILTREDNMLCSHVKRSPSW